MGESRFVSYSGDEKEIVRQGIGAIRSVLTGNDESAKLRLLLCLDWFMDPYYGQDISGIKDELIDLLQEVIVSDDSRFVKEDALDLLSSYVCGPFPILEENIGKVDEKFLPNVEYVVNMHRIEQIEPVMVEECNRLHKEHKSNFPWISDRVWILYDTKLSTSLYYESKKSDIEMYWLFENGELLKGVPYEGSCFSLVNEKGLYLRPEIHFNILLKEGKALIAYYFGSRYARCMEYDLICVDDKYSICNKKDVWVS